MTRLPRSLATLLVVGGVVSRPAQGQSLSQRIAGAPDGRVQFSYASRPAACGDGRSYLRINWSPNSNEFYCVAHGRRLLLYPRPSQISKHWVSLRLKRHNGRRF